MLPIERQARIRELISTQKNMKISELSKTLNVSEMTIHRDLKPLLDEGYIIKTFGGISLTQQTSPTAPADSQSDTCVICLRATNHKLAYRLILQNGEIEMTCCAHCGLIRHNQLKDEIVQAIAHDFLRHTTVSAPLMYYVLDTSIDMGCCQPQVLAFEHQHHAEKFIKGFGGDIYSFSEATEMVYKKMQEDCCQHRQ